MQVFGLFCRHCRASVADQAFRKYRKCLRCCDSQCRIAFRCICGQVRLGTHVWVPHKECRQIMQLGEDDPLLQCSVALSNFMTELADLVSQARADAGADCTLSPAAAAADSAATISCSFTVGSSDLSASPPCSALSTSVSPDFLLSSACSSLSGAVAPSFSSTCGSASPSFSSSNSISCLSSSFTSCVLPGRSSGLVSCSFSVVAASSASASASASVDALGAPASSSFFSFSSSSSCPLPSFSVADVPSYTFYSVLSSLSSSASSMSPLPDLSELHQDCQDIIKICVPSGDVDLFHSNVNRFQSRSINLKEKTGADTTAEQGRGFRENRPSRTAKIRAAQRIDIQQTQLHAVYKVWLFTNEVDFLMDRLVKPLELVDVLPCQESVDAVAKTIFSSRRGTRTVLAPLIINSNHFTLVVRSGEQEVALLDSKSSGSLTTFRLLKRAVEKLQVFKGTMTHYHLQQQQDQFSCGHWVVRIARLVALFGLPPSRWMGHLTELQARWSTLLQEHHQLLAAYRLCSFKFRSLGVQKGVFN